MTVHLCPDGQIDLLGHCSSEDAELLLRHLLTRLERSALPGEVATVNWNGCEHLHTAVLQILLVAKPKLVGIPSSAFLRTHVLALLNPAYTSP
jgi:hypothetical protein